MASNDSSVGKRIVEALKMQNGESFAQDSSSAISNISNNNFDDEFNDGFNISEDNKADSNLNSNSNSNSYNIGGYSSVSNVSIDSAFQQSLTQNIGISQTDIPDDFEYPANVAVLRQLVAKLPQGVSKQMGATIIKQTLEAVGIPMSGVLEEARQVQAALSERARNCQASIIDCRKQINILETKSRQYQKQFTSMNDIINLFLHIN